MKIRKILITGSSGTIGTRLFEKLLERGYQVIGFDRVDNKWHSYLDELTIKGDLLRKEDLNKLPTDFDLIIHLAANARVYNLVLKPDLALENITTTYNILNFSRKNKIKNFIFSSSREVYGNKEQIISREKDVDIELCESPYTASKIADEALVCGFSKCYDINYIILRFSNVYGMYDRSNRFMPLVIQRIKKNQSIDIYGRNKILDFTYIDDCVEGIIKSIGKFFEVKNNSINIASGKSKKLIEVVQLIKSRLNSNSEIIIKSSLPGEVIAYTADISKAKKLLGYEPKYSFEKGINLTIDWYLKYGNNY